jgi:hypothetical protein
MASTEGSATVTSNAILGTSRSKIPSELSRNLASGAPLTTFEPFLRLPAELQLQVIKYAWLNEIQQTCQQTSQASHGLRLDLRLDSKSLRLA